MTNFLAKFWPALIPVAIFLFWLLFLRKKVTERDKEGIPTWEARLWLWTLLASLLIAGGIIVWTALSETPVKGQYVPPRYEDGKVIPGHVIPEQDAER